MDSGLDLRSILSQDDYTTKSDVGTHYKQRKCAYSPFSISSNYSSLAEVLNVRTGKGKKRGKMDKSKPLWKVPRSPDSSLAFSKKVNLIDRKTIYSDKQDRLLQTLETDNVVFPPLDKNMRMTAAKPDANLTLEKAVVMANYQNSPRSQPHQIRSMFPHASVKIIECASEDDDDMNSVLSSRDHTHQLITDHDHPRREQFCDVMNRKYCTDCIGQKNRQNIKRYDSAYLPALKKRDKVGSDKIAKKIKRIVINLNV
ncbi:hypothetical protein CAPTEDRAFT_192520 [Capitella teleta]|uniref:Uncharacterized protein n=1 Tax=Capitella teleta TaxID=283909 RepID=R7UZB9_CAPTE|nr:hypothetical protein CAPTEDRAFT_192520 [Capitella teleta]|eukprot:ELU09302.1 hypothetical protein CAPTEDRAFT_192520 [Capitella teleta]